MISLSARVSNPTFKQWKMINVIMLDHIRDSDGWSLHGYDGISELTSKLFGFRVIRNAKSTVEFIFDKDEDYVYFKLRWFR